MNEFSTYSIAEFAGIVGLSTEVASKWSEFLKVDMADDNGIAIITTEDFDTHTFETVSDNIQSLMSATKHEYDSITWGYSSVPLDCIVSVECGVSALILPNIDSKIQEAKNFLLKLQK